MPKVHVGSCTSTNLHGIKIVAMTCVKVPTTPPAANQSCVCSFVRTLAIVHSLSISLGLDPTRATPLSQRVQVIVWYILLGPKHRLRTYYNGTWTLWVLHLNLDTLNHSLEAKILQPKTCTKDIPQKKHYSNNPYLYTRTLTKNDRTGNLIL